MTLLALLDFFIIIIPSLIFFFFNDTATTEIYTLSLHDALPISRTYMKPPSCRRRVSSSRSYRSRCRVFRDRCADPRLGEAQVQGGNHEQVDHGRGDETSEDHHR